MTIDLMQRDHRQWSSYHESLDDSQKRHHSTIFWERSAKNHCRNTKSGPKVCQLCRLEVIDRRWRCKIPCSRCLPPLPSDVYTSCEPGHSMLDSANIQGPPTFTKMKPKMAAMRRDAAISSLPAWLYWSAVVKMKTCSRPILKAAVMLRWSVTFHLSAFVKSWTYQHQHHSSTRDTHAHTSSQG